VCLLLCMFELFDPNSETRISVGTNLPHWFQPGATYFVTWRTADSVPKSVARQWHQEREMWLKRNGATCTNQTGKPDLDSLSPKKRQEYHGKFSKQFMEFLDQGYGACELKRPELAKIVADSLLHFDGVRYQISDFVVMPNHVHVLVGLIGETDILKQCYSWKKFSAAQINKRLGKVGRFWQAESFDHLVRSEAQFEAIQGYIAGNPKCLLDEEFLLYQAMQ